MNTNLNVTGQVSVSQGLPPVQDKKPLAKSSSTNSLGRLVTRNLTKESRTTPEQIGEIFTSCIKKQEGLKELRQALTNRASFIKGDTEGIKGFIKYLFSGDQKKALLEEKKFLESFVRCIDHAQNAAAKNATSEGSIKKPLPQEKASPEGHAQPVEHQQVQAHDAPPPIPLSTPKDQNPPSQKAEKAADKSSDTPLPASKDGPPSPPSMGGVDESSNAPPAPPMAPSIDDNNAPPPPAPDFDAPPLTAMNAPSAPVIKKEPKLKDEPDSPGKPQFTEQSKRLSEPALRAEIDLYRKYTEKLEASIGGATQVLSNYDMAKDDMNQAMSKLGKLNKRIQDRENAIRKLQSALDSKGGVKHEIDGTNWYFLTPEKAQAEGLSSKSEGVIILTQQLIDKIKANKAKDEALKPKFEKELEAARAQFTEAEEALAGQFEELDASIPKGGQYNALKGLRDKKAALLPPYKTGLENREKFLKGGMKIVKVKDLSKPAEPASGEGVDIKPKSPFRKGYEADQQDSKAALKRGVQKKLGEDALIDKI